MNLPDNENYQSLVSAANLKQEEFQNLRQAVNLMVKLDETVHAKEDVVNQLKDEIVALKARLARNESQIKASYREELFKEASDFYKLQLTSETKKLVEEKELCANKLKVSETNRSDAQNNVNRLEDLLFKKGVHIEVLKAKIIELQAEIIKPVPPKES